MKIVEIRPRRKFVSGIVFDCDIDPKEYGADVDAAGYLSLDSELCEIKHLKSGMTLSDRELTELVQGKLVNNEPSSSHNKKQGVQYGTIKKETYFSKKANKNKPYNIIVAIYIVTIAVSLKK